MVSVQQQVVSVKDANGTDISTLHDAITQIMYHFRGTYKPGSAPRGALERDAEVLLQQIGISSQSVQSQVQTGKKGKGSTAEDEGSY
eukprot:9500287-Pyramimonas_sp.AAC.1